MEIELRDAAVRSGELAVSAAAQPNGACLQLGSLCLLLVENTWGWLGSDDQLVFPMTKEIEIHEQVLTFSLVTQQFDVYVDIDV